MIIKGDVNGDGRITVEDIMLAQANILGSIQLDENQLIAADANNSGSVTTLDLLVMQRHILGVEILNEVIE